MPWPLRKELVARIEDPGVRIVLWHGYLLAGTGSNVYTRALAREWAWAGHDVTVHTSNPAVDLLHALYFHLT